MKNCALRAWRRHRIHKGTTSGLLWRRRQDFHGDGVRDSAMTSGRGRPKEDLESYTWRRCSD
ncbi:hypothetical protein Tco_0372453, partial [Tanacetum coccineum]